MQQQFLSYAQTGAFSKFVLDYLAQTPSIQAFQQYTPSITAIPDVIQRLQNYDYDRKLLSQVLQEQYATLEQKELSLSHIKALEQPNTFVVITGHQTNLFTGPLYFIYKVAATIKLARQLSTQYPNYRFVPMYWMGSEDHDFEEINHLHLWGQTLRWDLEAHEGATGRLPTSSLQTVIDELEALAGNRMGKEAIIALLRKSYLEEQTLAAATRAFVHALFGKHGLIILDQDHPRFKSSFKQPLKRELTEQLSHQHIQATNNRLVEAGYYSQAYSRPINLFYLTNDFRHRINFEKQSNLYKIADTNIQFTKDELLADLTDHPARYSPNVIMRPIYQQHLVPAVANIGGGGELAYWLQLKEVFQAYQVPYPMILLRNSVLLVDAASQKKIRKQGLSLEDLFQEEQAFIKRYALEQAQIALHLETEAAQINGIFADIIHKATLIDPTLEQSVKGEQQKTLNSLKKLEAKLVRAEKRKHELFQQQFANVKTKLFPNGKLQERYNNVIPYLMQYGLGFVDTIVEALEPMQGEFMVLEE